MSNNRLCERNPAACRAKLSPVRAHKLALLSSSSTATACGLGVGLGSVQKARPLKKSEGRQQAGALRPSKHHVAQMLGRVCKVLLPAGPKRRRTTTPAANPHYASPTTPSPPNRCALRQPLEPGLAKLQENSLAANCQQRCRNIKEQPSKGCEIGGAQPCLLWIGHPGKRCW